MRELAWKLRPFREGLSAPEKAVTAANALWAGLWLLIVLASVARNDAGSSFASIFAVVVWFPGQMLLALVGLATSFIFGNREDR